jgi:GNAT superfamily N-acetyltransferase
MLTPVIRKASSVDWTAIAGICADTGRQGQPVGDDEREAFAEHWIGPYRDTLSFEKERRRLLKPQPDSREFFPQAVRLQLWTEHPAHLHMNVSADYRGYGTGAALLRACFAELRKAGVPSAHVICGPSAAPFWERMAFRTEAVVEAAPGVKLRAMTRPVE